jgi:hypothetical protein
MLSKRILSNGKAIHNTTYVKVILFVPKSRKRFLFKKSKTLLNKLIKSFNFIMQDSYNLFHFGLYGTISSWDVEKTQLLLLWVKMVKARKASLSIME